MDFGAFPPEFNSARMYTGAGSGPLLAAAAAWDGLTSELGSAASAYASVISGLVDGSWLGPGSAAMAAAASPYVAWMARTAGQAEQAAGQARLAAAAYESAFAMTVPPPVIAANRAQLMALIATNFLGQNTPAIAATEAQYAEMWGQDAAAMYGYAAASAAATKVDQFSAPAQTTSLAGVSAQGAAVAQAQLSQGVSAVPGALQALSSPTAVTGTSSGIGAIASALGLQPGDLSNAVTNLASGFMTPYSLAGITQVGSDLAVLRGAALAPHDPFGLGALDGLLGGFPAAPGVGIGAFGQAGFGEAAAVSASLSRAPLVGALSVPQGWAAASPPASLPAATPLLSSWTAVPETGAAGTPGVPGMPIMSSGARSIGFVAPRYGFRPSVIAHPPAAG
ncbi:PPE family protein PPE51 [Mycobacterium tuberculosis H37Rv] [Mycobacterium shimoidei]|uniref:PPE family protein PPE51 [Mycobacterium tuberculosis H37Rv] n=1 Tax=Mycobacterium shimoidei TaxID=29313 RepID=A0A375Z258_MYCSH|nr:PPE family protein [Mycobacterium shimoidei]SRX95241.1 PPE family protein PPE51 [Mycobacterium tuberculosis H37Rv] [Mycobacterium shimoidei]